MSTADDCLEGEQDRSGALTQGSPQVTQGRRKESLKHKNSSTNGKAGTERSGRLPSESLISGFRLSGKVAGSVVILRVVARKTKMGDIAISGERHSAQV